MTRKRRRRSSREKDSAEGSENAAGDISAIEESTHTHEESSHWLSRVLGLIPVIICFMGTGRNPWALGFAAITVGLLAVLFPARNRIPYVLMMVIAAVALPGLLGLAPITLPFQPEWKTALANDLQMPMAATISAQPFITFENWAWFAVMLLWFCWGFSYWQTSGDRGPTLRVIALGLSLLALVSLFFQFINWEPSTWKYARYKDIGPFANRNHFACLMAMNAVLCLTSAYDLLRRRKRSWMLYGLCVVPTFAVVLLIRSRAGIALFFGGIIVWFFAASVRKRSIKRLAIGGTTLLILTAGLVLFGQQLMSRFASSQGTVIETLIQDERFNLYRDVVDVIVQNPTMGVGLGNFAAVYGMTNHLAQGSFRFRHPESDWLWFLTEAGWPATFAALVGVFLLMLWMGPWRSAEMRSIQRRERRLRLAAGLTALLAIFHGVVDVPNHDLPMAMLVALLAAMAFHHHYVSAAPGRAAPRLSQAFGIVAIVFGGLWWATGAGMTNVMGQTAWQKHMARAKQLLSQGDAAGAWPEINIATKASPLSWEAWFVRAETSLKLAHPQSEAMLDFARSRYLEPNMADYCIAEGYLWMDKSPAMAISAWREGLRRYPGGALGHYMEMVRYTKGDAALRQGLRDLATDSRLLLAFLSSTEGKEFESTLGELLLRFPNLEGLSQGERATLFNWWRSRGNRQELVKALQAHEDWMPAGWSYLAQELGAAGKVKEAFTIAKKYVVPKINLASESIAPIEQLDREFKFSPSDPQRGFNLYVAQRNMNRLDEALKTLETMSTQPNVPNDVLFEIAKVYALKGNYEKAWATANRYLQL